MPRHRRPALAIRQDMAVLFAKSRANSGSMRFSDSVRRTARRLRFSNRRGIPTMVDQSSKTDSIFWSALKIAAPDERDRYLEEACADDANLRAQLDELLAA